MMTFMDLTTSQIRIQDTPVQSSILQDAASTGSPRQFLLPPGPVHVRILHRVPWSQDAEHWLHSPHGCQVPATAGIIIENAK